MTIEVITITVTALVFIGAFAYGAYEITLDT
jgi:hypothetical protein